ncbi:uncharacterized protein [Macrobrachium rosenbergii]|uniref:uncharacterized protein n=1 Tax=Macrobrachium rosenbergii TaxID=79674 RepID=UPI0034D71E11
MTTMRFSKRISSHDQEGAIFNHAMTAHNQRIARIDIITNMEIIDRTAYHRRLRLLEALRIDMLRDDLQFVWGEGQQLAFQKIKEALMSPPVLKFPDFVRPFTLVTDASHDGIEACLMQKSEDNGIVFVNKMECVAEVTGIRKVTIILHTPKANGLCERANGKLRRIFDGLIFYKSISEGKT